MIRSMTGFGHGEAVNQDYKLTIELKAVNHRYCDIGIKLPRKFQLFENKIRSLLKKSIFRGKIDVFINYEDYNGQHSAVNYHENIAAGYIEAMKKAGVAFGLDSGISAAALIRMPEVISLEEKEVDVEGIYPVMEKVLLEALRQFLLARETEGEHLKQDLKGKLEKIRELTASVEKRSPELIGEYQKRLEDKVEELLGDRKLEEHILATELALYADKICVDEETVRLRAHIKNMLDTLEAGENVGRKLDFIAQEMNREANTILSKANHQDVSSIAIELKTEIEKVREQIQNIE